MYAVFITRGRITCDVSGRGCFFATMAYAAGPYLMASSSSPTSSEDEEDANWKAALREKVEEVSE